MKAAEFFTFYYGLIALLPMRTSFNSIVKNALELNQTFKQNRTQNNPDCDRL